MDEYIIYNTTYHILICRQCGYAIPQDGIMRHYRRFHKTIPLVMRQEIINYGLSLDLLQPSKVQELWETLNVNTTIKGLTVYSGFQCQYEGCVKYARTEISMKQHCRETHNWVAKERIIWKKQQLQTIFGGQFVK